jgi:acyl-CoA synthetase (AMP-forming)/AMP-acid ligase II
MKNEHSTLVHLLRWQAGREAGDKGYTFLIDGELETRRITYRELDQKARAIAAALQGVAEPGARALLFYGPGLDYIAAFFGCLYAGVVAVPAYPPQRQRLTHQLQSIAKNSGATLALTTTDFLGDIEAHLAHHPELRGLRWVATDDVEGELALDWHQPRIDPDTLAFLQYTSGSSGAPKGVKVSHENLIHNQHMIEAAFGHTAETVVFSWLPMFHDMGLIGNVLQPLHLGVDCVLMSPLAFLKKPARWLQGISRYRATSSGGADFAFAMCAHKVRPDQCEGLDLRCWQVAFTGSEPVRSQTLEAFGAKFEPYGFRREAFYPCYGMAEATLFVSGGLSTDAPVTIRADQSALEQGRVEPAYGRSRGALTLVSCGRPWLRQELCIVNPESRAPCEGGQVGEIWLRGPGVAQGYWGQPEETAEAFEAYLPDGRGPFLRTGDLGAIVGGELYIAGRLKDVIIVRGRNHYPQDIELTVQNSHRALQQDRCAVFSVDVDEAERLIIVQEIDLASARGQGADQIIGDIQQAVTRQHGLAVHDTLFVKKGSIPKTSSGKTRRLACRGLFLAGRLDIVKDSSGHVSNV